MECANLVFPTALAFAAIFVWFLVSIMLFWGAQVLIGTAYMFYRGAVRAKTTAPIAACDPPCKED